MEFSCIQPLIYSDKNSLYSLEWHPKNHRQEEKYL